MGASATLLIIILLVITFFFFRKRNKKPLEDHPTTAFMPLLNKRWDEIRAEIKEHGHPLSVPRWWADECTQAQLDRLQAEDVYLNIELTKGQCADLIGTLTDPQEEDLDLLEFFGVEPEGDSQIEIREQLRTIFKNPENREKWKKHYQSK